MNTLKVGDQIKTVEQMESLPVGAQFTDRHSNEWTRYAKGFKAGPGKRVHLSEVTFFSVLRLGQPYTLTYLPEPAPYVPEVGHRVRVTVEGEVVKVGDNDLKVRRSDDTDILFSRRSPHTVERIPEPVEVFTDGVVRSRKYGRVYTILAGGKRFLCHRFGDIQDLTAPFTSEDYERAELVWPGES